MCYIILPNPELIYYVQHCLYAPIGAIEQLVVMEILILFFTEFSMLLYIVVYIAISF